MSGNALHPLYRKLLEISIVGVGLIQLPKDWAQRLLEVTVYHSA